MAPHHMFPLHQAGDTVIPSPLGLRIWGNFLKSGRVYEVQACAPTEPARDEEDAWAYRLGGFIRGEKGVVIPVNPPQDGGPLFYPSAAKLV